MHPDLLLTSDPFCKMPSFDDVPSGWLPDEELGGLGLASH
jgi:hypothetical protein